MDINYFDFLRKFPYVVDETKSPLFDINYYINFVEDIHKDNPDAIQKPLINISCQKLSELVLKAKETNDEKLSILRSAYLTISIDDDILFILKQNENLSNYIQNNLDELKGKFHLTINCESDYLKKKYSYLDDDQKKNLKRNILIKRCLGELK